MIVSILRVWLKVDGHEYRQLRVLDGEALINGHTPDCGRRDRDRGQWVLDVRREAASAGLTDIRKLRARCYLREQLCGNGVGHCRRRRGRWDEHRLRDGRVQSTGAKRSSWWEEGDAWSLEICGGGSRGCPAGTEYGTACIGQPYPSPYCWDINHNVSTVSASSLQSSSDSRAGALFCASLPNEIEYYGALQSRSYRNVTSLNRASWSQP